jgi:2',3'-cyclic-nucleotide 2'-phosphodiesterase (5'-nucleotidase family)
MAARRLLIVLLLVEAAAPQAAAQRSPTFTLSVIATTDLHGGVLPRGTGW